MIRLGKKEGATSAIILQQNGDALFNFFQGACGKPEQSKGLSHKTRPIRDRRKRTILDVRFRLCECAKSQHKASGPSAAQRRSAKRLQEFL